VRRGVASLAVLVASVAVACGGSQHEARPRNSAPAAGGATVVKRAQVAPRVVDLTIRSPALGATAQVRLLTPQGWTAGGAGRTWPVLYLLHGCCDTYDSWERETDLARISALRDVLVVMPSGGEVGFYSDWLNHGRRGAPAWETFHLDELRRILERDYGAGSRRAIAGLSMGGLGAMAYAARHPGMFAAAASYSGLLSPLRDDRVLLSIFADHTPDPEAIWGDPASDRAQWAAHDPTELAARLRGTSLFVSSGNGRPGPIDRERRSSRDPAETTVYGESRAFVGRLQRLHIPVRADFYGAGVHDWPYWQRELHRSLPMLLGAIGAGQS
jgi:S-formylglutathione hydrolase FrmB